MNDHSRLEKIVSLCKRRGFVFQSADIYGGMNGFYDFGHLGTLLKHNIRNAWIKSLYTVSDAIVLFEGALLAPHAVWQASGHTQHFQDPMVDCTNCKKRYRTDDVDLEKPCPHCGKKAWTESRMFNMMFQTHVGAAADQASVAYLRPETAQAIYVNFKNVLATHRVKMPFGIAQIGKAYRNEITPKQFLFRMREFEQMELEWFCKPNEAAHYFDIWLKSRQAFYTTIGINPKNIHLFEQPDHERAHYSARTVDIEYAFPFGWKELEGIANRGDYDLSQHSKHSGKDLQIYDDETKSSYMPHIVECSVGVDRLFLTLLFDAYTEDTVDNEERIYLNFAPTIAPIKAAFLPLVKKLSDPMLAIYQSARQQYMVEFDDSGSVGKRYRRQDEIGTPVCFTYDFESEATQTVTARERNSTQQTRIKISEIEAYLKNMLSSNQ